MPKISDIWIGNNSFCWKCISGPADQWYGQLVWYVSAFIAVVILSIFVTPTIWK